jgi:hypothetical protein
MSNAPVLACYWPEFLGKSSMMEDGTSTFKHRAHCAFSDSVGLRFFPGVDRSWGQPMVEAALINSCELSL